MKAKSILKMLSAVVTTGMISAAMALPTLAAGTPYDPIAAQDATFNKYLLLETDMKVPTLNFNYTVKSDEVTAIVPDDPDHLPLYAGPSITTTGATPVTYPNIATVSFSGTDTAEDSTLLTGYSTYKKTITVDFGEGNDKVTFNEPGVYRYYIKEVKDANAAGLYYDVDLDATKLRTDGDLYRTLDVYVEDNTSDSGKKLKVTGYIMYDGKVTTAPNASATAVAGDANAAITDTQTIEVNGTTTPGVTGANKTDNYVNFYDAFSLTFGKEVTGNQGSKDKYFKLSLSLTSPVDVEFTVDISKADASITGNSATTYSNVSNVTTITATAGDPVSTDFYLQDGQYITVKGIPAGTVYALTEVEEGYKKTATIAESLSTFSVNTANDDPKVTYEELIDNVSGTITNKDIYTGYTNAKDGILPTGILVKATPVIVIAVLAIAGVVFFAVRNAKNKDLDDEAETAEE